MSIFKRLFGRSKNDSQEDVKVDYEVKDLKKGFILDYDLRSWEVRDTMIYRWDNGVEDLEFTIFDGKEELYLNYVKSNDGISMYWAEKLDAVWQDARSKMRYEPDRMGDSSFVYNGHEFRFAGEGYARVRSSKETFDMQNWLFECTDGENLVSFNKYEDGSMEVYVGKHLANHEVSNILPRG